MKSDAEHFRAMCAHLNGSAGNGRKDHLPRPNTGDKELDFLWFAAALWHPRMQVELATHNIVIRGIGHRVTKFKKNSPILIFAGSKDPQFQRATLWRLVRLLWEKGTKVKHITLSCAVSSTDVRNWTDDLAPRARRGLIYKRGAAHAGTTENQDPAIVGQIRDALARGQVRWSIAEDLGISISTYKRIVQAHSLASST